MRLAPWNRFKPSRKSILLTVPRRYSFVDRFCWLCFMFGGVVLSCLFLVALWSPAGKGLTSWLLCLSCFVTFPNVPWSTSELRARLAPWNCFKPSKIFYWPFQGGSSFVDHLCYLCLVFIMLLRLFIAALWSPARKGLTSWLLFVMSNCDFVTFLCGILGQLWYLIILIHDLCRLSYFDLQSASVAVPRHIHFLSNMVRFPNVHSWGLHVCLICSDEKMFTMKYGCTL